jgi:hypothetical protein
VAVDLAIALCVLVLIAAAALRPVETSPRARLVGWGLIAVPLPAVLAVHLSVLHSGRLDEILFVSALVAFALGAVLVLGRDDRRDDGPAPDDPEPHWWPDFEREFRTYARTRPHPPARLVRR